MIRESLAALALVILIAAPTSVAAPQASQPTWSVTQVAQNVSYGSPIQLIVSGPANGTFNATLEGQPFNRSEPIYVETFTMPNATGNSSKAVSIIVSFPTRPLYYGGFLVLVANTSLGLGISAMVYYVVNPVNDTNVQNNLGVVWEELNITTARELALLYQQGLLEQQLEELFWVMIAIVVLFMSTVIVTRTGAANRRWGKRLRAMFHNAFYEPNMSESIEGRTIKREIPPSDETRVWVSKLFPDCEMCQTPNTEPGIALHLRQDHRVPEPKRGRDYEIKAAAVKTAVMKRAGQEPAERKLRDAIEEMPMDFSDVTGG